MQKTELKKIWYGKKTFYILKEFCHQGIIFHPRSLFACDKETYNERKKFLGAEYTGELKKEVVVVVKEQPVSKKKTQKRKKR